MGGGNVCEVKGALPMLCAVKIDSDDWFASEESGIEG